MKKMPLDKSSSGISRLVKSELYSKLIFYTITIQEGILFFLVEVFFVSC